MAVKKFLKFDSEKGYLEDKDDINYYATSQMRKVAFGKMIGDFDENGLYVINEKIVEELIKMPKVIVEMVEDADLIRSKVKADTFFHFILTVEDNKASFKLLEKLYYQSNRDFNSGVYSNINEYVLDEMIVPDKDFDRNALYQKYNISTENDSDVLSIFDMDELSLALYYNIVEKLKTNYLVQNELILKEKELEALEADYFESVLGALTEFEEFGAKVTSALQDDLAEKHSFMIISRPFFQQAVNEVLDSNIEQYINTLSPEQRESFLARLREIKADYYQKFKTLLPVEIAQKSGVRFDNNQIIEEGIIGSLAQEIVTKGYTSSDVRKIRINDDELQLAISKIKENVKENEEACKRDNANAKDITKGRELTTKFYKELENKKKTDLLTPDTTIIKSAISENTNNQTVKADNTKKAVAGSSVSVGGKTNKSETKKDAKQVKPAKKADSTQKAGGKSDTAKKGDKKDNKKEDTKAKEQKKENSPLVMYGSGSNFEKKEESTTRLIKPTTEKDKATSNLLDELGGRERGLTKDVKSVRRTDEVYVRSEHHDLTI